MFGTKASKETPCVKGRGLELDSLLDVISSCASQAASVTETIVEYSGISKQIRRTDAEISSDMSGLDKSPYEYQYEFSVPLKSAVNMANSEPGVYVLYLDGRVMKCGRAAYSQGVAWRLRQYYSLSYDNQSRSGDCWSINEKNRDRVTVSWQCCPASKCDELESKLFQKYGKGEWAKRMPVYDGGDSWVLII